jgi:predicted 2-oxoglutarate/Fe(II)-dependent dioxygenase YbiX
MDILVEPGFVTSVECERLIAEFRRVAEVDVCTRRQTVRTELPAAALRQHGFRDLDPIRDRVLTDLANFYAVSDLFLEFTLLSEMRAGDRHVLHADNERFETGTWVPNHTPFRSHAAMLYLNTSGTTDGFRGGVLRFPDVGRDIVPVAGTLVGFTCGRVHQHEVTAVEDGIRYAVAFWMTLHCDRAERWK